MRWPKEWGRHIQDAATEAQFSILNQKPDAIFSQLCNDSVLQRANVLNISHLVSYVILFMLSGRFFDINNLVFMVWAIFKCMKCHREAGLYSFLLFCMTPHNWYFSATQSGEGACFSSKGCDGESLSCAAMCPSHLSSDFQIKWMTLRLGRAQQHSDTAALKLFLPSHNHAGNSSRSTREPKTMWDSHSASLNAILLN